MKNHLPKKIDNSTESFVRMPLDGNVNLPINRYIHSPERIKMLEVACQKKFKMKKLFDLKNL